MKMAVSLKNRIKWLADQISVRRVWMDCFFLLVLIVFPMRKVYLGVDLWDQGYNYANFFYPGLDHMDSMWYFATWISTEVGHLLTFLPFSDRLLFMNIYTSLVVSILAAGGYLFSVKYLKLPPVIAFLAEVTACNMCWAPTAILYNYLTFLFFMFSVMALYKGLTEGRKGFLVLAGILLGLNVGVRFSNLSEVGLILAVWIYAACSRKTFQETVSDTLWCALGYALSAGLFFLLMSVLYTPMGYLEGVGRLFAMTDTAKEYSSSSMLVGLFKEFYRLGYWIKRFLLVLIPATVVCAILPGRFRIIKNGITTAAVFLLFLWLKKKNFTWPDFRSYEYIYDPCVVFFFLALIMALTVLIYKEVTAQDRLIAALTILMIYLTTLGGNNVVFYCINNLFLILPGILYLFILMWKHFRQELFFPMKMIMTLSLLWVMAVSLHFGKNFVYEEAAGLRQPIVKTEGIHVLQGIGTDDEKAEYLMETYRFLKEGGLLEKKYIFFGDTPGLSCYFQLEPAMNIWPDLDSYVMDVYGQELDGMAEKLKNGGESPVVIVNAAWRGFTSFTEEEPAMIKYRMLEHFIEETGMEMIYSSEKYSIYTKKEQ